MKEATLCKDKIFKIMATKKQLLFILLLLFLKHLAYSQVVMTDNTPKFSGKTILSWNPLALFGSGLELNFERRVKEGLSLRYTLGYYLAENPAYYSSYDGFNGLKVEIQPRFYLRTFSQSRKGLYISPFVQYKHINLYKDISFLLYTGTPPTTLRATERDNTFASATALGFVFGRQELSLNSRFTTDIFAGVGVLIPINQYQRSIPNLFLVNQYEQGIFLKLGASIGLSFN